MTTPTTACLHFAHYVNEEMRNRDRHDLIEISIASCKRNAGINTDPVLRNPVFPFGGAYIACAILFINRNDLKSQLFATWFNRKAVERVVARRLDIAVDSL